MIDMLPWIVAAASLIVLLVATVGSARAQSQLRVAHEESIATKNEQIASLEAQLASLRESESIRFVDRYLAAKKGLEDRTSNLNQLLETAREQQDKLRDELSDLGLTEGERESEKDRLLRDLNRTSDQIRRLELILREVAHVGPMDVNPIRAELDGRRELSAHIQDRLERLTSQEQDRVAARRSRTQTLERLNEEASGYRRDIEITRAAASIVDGILGIDSDTRKRLARHAAQQIKGALETLGDAARRDPISKFVDVLEQQRPDRLLHHGKPAAPPVAQEGEASSEPGASLLTPEPRVESRDRFFTVLP
jgi:chromosome segregation ATPase